MGSGNGVKKESFLCAALKTEKRVSTAPVRADHVSGVPETLKNVFFFASVFRTGLLSVFFPDLGIIFGASEMQNAIILAQFVSSVRD